MKIRYTLLFAAGVICTLIACKKESNVSVIAKWQETKLRIYTLNAAGGILNDTTYSGQSFTSLDYAQFNSNGTCVISQSHYYYPADEGYPKDPQVAAYVGTLNYTPVGTSYILSSASNLVNPGGFVSTDTAKLAGPNNLLIHVSEYGHSLHNPATVYDSYYTRY